MAGFFQEIRERARSGSEFAAIELLARADALRIRSIDLLVGLIQPALYEIGELWAKAQVTVAAEHRFSAFAESLAALVLARTLSRGGNDGDRREFLIVNAEGNQHTLGVRLVEVMLRSAGRSVTAIVPGLPAREVLGMARVARPAVVGVSVSMLPQMQSAQEIASALAEFGPDARPRLLVGGLAVNLGLHPAAPPPFELCGDPFALLGAARSTATAEPRA